MLHQNKSERYAVGGRAALRGTATDIVCAGRGAAADDAADVVPQRRAVDPPRRLGLRHRAAAHRSGGAPAREEVATGPMALTRGALAHRGGRCGCSTRATTTRRRRPRWASRGCFLGRDSATRVHQYEIVSKFTISHTWHETAVFLFSRKNSENFASRI